ncbi:MAG: hypothetical protein MO846_02470 [Candidatus Devosia symbiotica]|nr:hypothetical protein [Candidatus Devosia symbiotica]
MAQPKQIYVPAAYDKLRALSILALNGMFDEMDAVGVLPQAATEMLPGDLAIVSSFGANSAVLLHLVAQVDPSLPIYFFQDRQAFLGNARLCRDAEKASWSIQCARHSSQSSGHHAVRSD